VRVADLAYNRKQLSAASLIHTPVLFVLYALLYGPTWADLIREWYEHENFSYGFLIPAIAVSLIWQKRWILRDLRGQSSPWGSMILVTAVVIGLIGKAIGEQIVMRVSLVLALAGIVHLVWGRQVLQALSFPIAYLFLMIPPPYVIVKQISVYLKTFDAVIAAGVLKFIDIPVYRDSYFLHLPSITLEVADVCSGIASLFAMFALGIIFTYYLPVRKGSKVVLLLGTIVFPVLANLFRIVLTSVSVYYWGPVMLKSFFHNFTGTFTFLLSLILLVLGGEYLRLKYPLPASRTSADRGRAIPINDRRLGDSSESKQGPYLYSPSWLAAITILTLAIYSSTRLEAGAWVPLRRSLTSIPSQLGPYRTSEKPWTGVYDDPDAERAVSRVYEGPRGDLYEVFVGYSGLQTGERRLSSPMLRLPKGWDYAYKGSLTAPMRIAHIIEANWLLVRQATQKRVVLYWYQAGDRTLSGEWDRRFNFIKRLFLENRSDGAVVRIATTVMPYEDPDQARKRIYNIAAFVHREVAQIVPR